MGNLVVSDLQRQHRTDPLWLWARSLPKIDLHRHLEGSLRLSTLVELAPECGIELDRYDAETLRPLVQMTEDAPDFQRFLAKFDILRLFYVSPEVIKRMTREAISDAARDGVVYLELRFNPLALARLNGFSFADVVTWVIEATEEGQRETHTRTCLILQIPRQESLAVADEIVDLAIANFGPLVRGIDLAGDEVNYSPELFAEQFSRAHRAGLNVTVHAGEAMGAHSVESAVHALHPHRIGHGVRAVEDSSVVTMLRERSITLEICPTSNLHTGVFSDLSHHPLADLVNLGLQVTVNTDDPSVSDTTLTHEVAVSVGQIGLAQLQYYRVLRYAVEASFLSPVGKIALRELIRTKIDRHAEAAAAFEAAATIATDH